MCPSKELKIPFIKFSHLRFTTSREGRKKQGIKGGEGQLKKLTETEQEPVRVTGRETFHIPASLYPKDIFLVLESQR